MEIVRKVERREWDEATLSVDEFIRFDSLYDGVICPTFNFDNDSVLASDVWGFSIDGYLSITSYEDGVVGFSRLDEQYIKHSNAKKRLLGNLLSVKFTVDEDMRETLNKLKESE